MSEFYFEICIIPSNFFDIFVSEIIDFNDEAIELKDDSIIIRTANDEYDVLISYLEDLSLRLSKINNTYVSFTHSIIKKENKDWIAEYQKSITPLECGRFYIYPPWEQPYKKNYNLTAESNLNYSKINIILEPSLAFGSGHHASTYMCLEALENCNIKSSTTLLDIGCGSGILALCANKLGANVSLCDIDELAISEAKKNFAINNAKFDDIWIGSINGDKKYDIVVANIIASVILDLRDKILLSVNKGGIIILSGILDIYKNSVLEAFSNIDILDIKSKDEWICLILQKREKL